MLPVEVFIPAEKRLKWTSICVGCAAAQRREAQERMSPEAREKDRLRAIAYRRSRREQDRLSHRLRTRGRKVLAAIEESDDGYHRVMLRETIVDNANRGTVGWVCWLSPESDPLPISGSLIAYALILDGVVVLTPQRCLPEDKQEVLAWVQRRLAFNRKQRERARMLGEL